MEISALNRASLICLDAVRKAFTFKWPEYSSKSRASSIFINHWNFRRKNRLNAFVCPNNNSNEKKGETNKVKVLTFTPTQKRRRQCCKSCERTHRHRLLHTCQSWHVVVVKKQCAPENNNDKKNANIPRENNHNPAQVSQQCMCVCFDIILAGSTAVFFVLIKQERMSNFASW